MSDRVISRTEELAWAAGFFDGEGCSTMRRKPSGYCSPRLSLKQKDRTLLEKFQRIIGGAGAIYFDKSSTGVWAWICGAASAEDVMWLLWPWLSKPKREQWFIISVEWDRQRGKVNV
jgi:LAGLIDADG endonuclease